MVDIKFVKELELEEFKKDLDNIENQNLNLIYNPLIDEIQERIDYDNTISLIEWKCAICGKRILVNKLKDDVNNFVCDDCRITYNNTNEYIDRRILESRNKLYKYIEERIYQEIDDRLKGGV